MKKIITGFIVIFGVLVLAGIFFWVRNQSSGGVAVNINVPEDVQLGVPFDLELEIENNSRDTITKNEVSVSLPQEIILAGSGEERPLVTKTFSDIEPGDVATSSIQIVAVAGENSIKEIKATLSYETGKFSSRFEARGEKSIVFTGAGMFIDVISPTKVLSGEEFRVKLQYRNDAENDFKNVAIKLEVPTDFTVVSELDNEFNKDEEGYIWNIGDINEGDEEELEITAVVSGQDASSADVTARAYAGSGTSTEYPISEKRATLVISPAPLSLRITLNKTEENYIVKPGDVLQYEIHYKNNTEIALQDIVIEVFPEGDMLDLSSIKSSGFLRSSDNAVVWNASRDSRLASISSGEEGRVTFEVDAKKDYPITSSASKNLEVVISGEIESPTVPRFLAVDRVFSTAYTSNKVGGDIDVATKGSFRDASSGIVNNGNVPPRVGQKTQYTIRWQLQNKTTDLNDVVVKAFLGSNVRYTGVYKSNNQTIPLYNERTQEMTWRIPRITATKGTLGAPVELIFQVELTPSVSQVNSAPVLIQKGQLTATDLFTGEVITKQTSEVTTAADTTLRSGEETVQN